MTIRKLTSALGLALLISGGAAQANLVQNGSFESGLAIAPAGYTTYTFGGADILPQWGVFSGSVDVVGNDYAFLGDAQQGSRFLDLNGDAAGGISQSFAVAANQQYQLSFWYALNGTNTAMRALVSVEPTSSNLNTSILRFQSAPSNDPIGWQLFSATFTSTSSSPVTLSFEALGGGAQGILLDNISVSAVPEPGTYAMLLAGLGALGFVARRRKAG